MGHDRISQDMSFGEKALKLLGPYNPFKQRGEAVLTEMHGRLGELNDQRRVFNSEPGNLGRAFPQERELRVLQRFSAAIERLEQVIQGRARTRMGLRQLPNAPEDVEIKRLREVVARLAKEALEVSDRARV
jgi:hypothetical protein